VPKEGAAQWFDMLAIPADAVPPRAERALHWMLASHSAAGLR